MGYAEFICKYAKVADSTTTQMWRGNKWDSRTEGREHHQTFLTHDPPERVRNPAMCHDGHGYVGVAICYGRKNQEKTGKCWLNHNEINNKVQFNLFFSGYFVLLFFLFWWL